MSNSHKGAIAMTVKTNIRSHTFPTIPPHIEPLLLSWGHLRPNRHLNQTPKGHTKLSLRVQRQPPEICSTFTFTMGFIYL